ncbi:MAG: M48 family metalloprotease [Bacteroidetes bacterium]|nr:M48 family metalloprotease [Bacteroidota bacterium]
MRQTLCRFLLWSLWLLPGLPGQTAAQTDFRHYTPLLSEGALPPDLLSVLHLNPNQAGTFGFREEFALYREEKINYLKHVQFAIYDMFSEGRVLFNDTLSRYVNQVAYTLIHRNPTLMRELRFYVVKSPAINAFVTENGMAFITTGLIARCQNEAQLAWALSRLVVHYIHQHRISGQDVFLSVSQTLQGLEQPDLEDRLLGRRLYGAADQIYADTACLGTYVRAGYAAAEALPALQVLGSLYGHAEDIFFSTVFLESEYLRIPQEYLPLVVHDQQPDAQSDGHIARFAQPKVRVSAMEQALTQWKRGGAAYLLPPEAFAYAVKLARYEQCLLLLATHRYARAFYQAYILELEDFANPFLEQVQLRALYGAAKATADSTSAGKQPDPALHSGQVTQLMHLFREIPPLELHCITLHVCLRHLQRYPSDTLVLCLAQDLAQDLRQRWQWEPQWLRTALASGEDAADFGTDASHKPVRTPLCLDALKDYAGNPLLYTLFEQDPADSLKVSQLSKMLIATGLKKPPVPPGHILLQDILFAKGDYLLADMRKTDKLQMETSLKTQFVLNQYMARQLDSLGLQAHLLDGAFLERDSLADYHNLQQLHLWLYERSKAPPGCLSLCPEYAPSGGQFGATCQVYTSRQHREHWPWVLAASAVVTPLLPAGLYYAATPAPQQTVNLRVYYLRTGQPAFTYSASIRADHWRQDLWHAHIHQALLQCSHIAVPQP